MAELTIDDAVDKFCDLIRADVQKLKEQLEVEEWETQLTWNFEVADCADRRVVDLWGTWTLKKLEDE